MDTNAAPNLSFFNRRDLLTFLSVLAPVFFIVSVGLYFHTFVLHAVGSNPAVNLGIIGTASLGTILIVLRLIAAQQDFRILLRFDYEANQGVYMKTLLDQPWLKNRYVRHYLSHIANTGGTLSSQLEQSSIESELHALEADYNSRLEFPQFLVGFMIAMGLLGTFIGLLETLTGISGMLDGFGGSDTDMQAQFLKLVTELRKPLAGMGIAFSASMFGLITSLMLAIMMTNLRRYISRLISLARNVMHDLTELTTERGARSFSTGFSPADVDKLLSGNNVVSSGIALAGSAQLFGRFDVLVKKIESLLESIDANTVSSRRLHELIGFGPRMKEVAEQTLEEIRILSSQGLDQQRVLQSLAVSSNDSLRILTAFLDAHQQSGAELSEHMRKIYGQLSKENSEKMLEEIRRMAFGTIEQQRLLQGLLTANGDIATTLMNQGEMHKQSSAEIIDQLRKLLNQVANVKDVNISSGIHLNEIKEQCFKLSKHLGTLDLIAANTGGNTSLLEVLVDETRQTQRTLASIGAST